MAKYMIHACPDRMWYVEGFLVPSMLEQGIKQEDIIVYNDEKQEGNLKACMHAFMEVSQHTGTWHLQDDVIICKNFREQTETHDNGLVCAFSSAMYDGTDDVGLVHRTKMWFSFPCIRIPNDWARECGNWVLKYIIGNPVYRDYWNKGVNDDWAFKAYMNNFHADETVLNLAPNLVDHIDYLLGGSSVGHKRKNQCRAQYWEDEDLVQELEVKINGMENK